MKKALVYASVASMIQQFNMSNIRILQELGYKVDVACNFEFGSTISQEKIASLKTDLANMNVRYFHIPVPRQISDFKNLNKSFKLTKDLMNNENYDLIHCHSPIGGIICRLANRCSKHYKNTKMIYTAHGFHFFKGNNPIRNFVFKNIERFGALFTDTLITINKEDYEAAKKFKLKKNGKVEYVPGVGIDVDKINAVEGNKEELCKELGISTDCQLLLSVGELSKRKNHKIVVQALAEMPIDVHYVICGQGDLKNDLIALARELGVADRLHLLGYRTNIPQIMKSCDIFVFPSLQEGLPVALMEAIVCGLPCIASKIRGNTDLILSDDRGILVDLKDNDGWFKAFDNFFSTYKVRVKKIINDYEFSTEKIESLYKNDIYLISII